MSSDPEVYKRQAEAAYQLGSELLKSARAAQIGIRPLAGEHSLADAARNSCRLPFKAHAGEHPHPTLEHCSGLWLVSFPLSSQHSRLGGIHLRDRAIPSPDRLRMLSDPQYWPQQTRAKL